MTIPSIKFKCPKCGKEEKSISDGPHYCYTCGGGKQTSRGWGFNGNPVRKVRKQTIRVGVRMKKV